MQNTRLRRANRAVAQAAHTSDQRPVVFFNASTRLAGLSQNAAYNLLARWAVQLSGAPVINFVCQSGMTRCVLGTNREIPSEPPPCRECIAQSRAVHAHSQTRWFSYQPDPELERALQDRSVADLMAFTHQDVPLGALCLPALRWILRRHTLLDDAPTRAIYSEYIRSAWNVQREFARLLDDTNPQAMVVFNGMFYPEAAARWTAHQRGLPVYSHEVGLRPFTAFFTPGDATAYPIQIPDSFQLDQQQNARLDAYLAERRQGNFSMAGIRFWPEMRSLDSAFVERLAAYRQMVPVFTNVIFDTSQPHSNVVFPHMFAWLDGLPDLARANPDTLFVLRAHPDEARPGKASRESVADWVQASRILELPNVAFFDPTQYISSYDLIERSKFVMVYNSTIGLEASLLGAPVLCAGRARFTQLPTVFFPATPAAHWQQAQQFLSAPGIMVPPEFQANARRFLYYQLFCTSLPFGEWLEEDGIWPGYVRLKQTDSAAFDPAAHPILKTVAAGILRGEEFLLQGETAR